MDDRPEGLNDDQYSVYLETLKSYHGGWAGVPSSDLDKGFALKCALASPRVRAICTWGDGPDVLLILNDHNGRHMFDLTSDEAQSLAKDLMNASRHSDEMEDMIIQHDSIGE